MHLSTRIRLAALLLATLTTASCFGGSGTDDSGAAPSAPASAASAAAASPSATGPVFPKTIHVGVKIDQPGFNVFDTSAHAYSGFEKELAEYLGEHLGFRPNFDDVPSIGREDRLLDGSVQLVIATYTITPDRLKKIDFVGPYLQTQQGLLVRADDKSVKTRKDVAGKDVCTAEGSTSETGPDNPLNKDARFVLAKDYKYCVKQLRDGNVDAVWTDRVILYGFADRYKDVRVVDKIKVGKTQLYGIGVPKHHSDQCHQLAAQLEEFLKTEWYPLFKQRFTELVETEPDFETAYKPADGDIDKNTRCTP